MIDPQSPKLHVQARHKIRARHYSVRTEDAYVGWIRRFILFHHKKHPRDMGEKEISALLSHLAVDGMVSASTQSQALCALLFLYGEVLDQDLGKSQSVAWAKKHSKLPVVFTVDKVQAVLAHLDGACWLMASLLYGSGLRLMEWLRLRVKDIDFGYKQILVRDGKGENDRVSVLPEATAEPLKHHLERVRLIHEQDLKEGHGNVYLPYALDRFATGHFLRPSSSQCWQGAVRHALSYNRESAVRSGRSSGHSGWCDG